MATETVRIAKLATAEPASITTVGGTTALLLEEERLTVRPPVEAGPSSVTVPVDDTPAGTDFGETVKPVREGGLTVTLTVTEALPTRAVIVALVVDETPVVPTLKLTCLEPAGTMTAIGTVTDDEFDSRLTVAPP